MKSRPPERTGRRNTAALTHAFRSLRNRNYRLYWFGQLVSMSGSWMQDVALSWLVLALTDSPVALGLAITIRFLPALLFSVYGGVLADRFPKRPTIVAAQAIQVFVALALAILTSTELVTVTIIYVLAGLRGLVDSIEGPIRQAFVPEMVGTEDLPNAVALNSTLFNSARIAGPAIGAVVMGVFDVATCFYINAVSFLALIAALLAMRTSDLHLASRPRRESSLRQLAEGFRYARSTPEVVVILIVMGTIGAFGLNFMTLLPLVTKYILGLGASTLALLTTTMGVGSVVAGLVAAYRGKPSQRQLLWAASAFVILLLGVGLSDWRTVTTVLMFLIGFVAVLFMTSANTRLQLGVPDHLRGRVMGMYILLFIGTTPIGSYLIGFMGEHLPLSTSELEVKATVVCMAGLCAIGVAVGALYARRVKGRDEPERVEDAE